MTYKCNGDCYSNYNEDDDDFVVQRLEDIITICKFLIKHQKNSKTKESLKQVIKQMNENEKEKDNDNNIKTHYYINRYKPNKPLWIMPYYHSYPWWDRADF